MDAKKVMVSIIVPAYNAEQFIERAITSVRNQTYSNLEILVINDGSKDKTRKIVESLCAEDRNIKLINTENQGVSCARNTGLEHATGSWVMFLDADDVLLDDAVESLLDCAIIHNLDIVSAKYQYTHSGDELVRNDSESVSVYLGAQGILRSIEDFPETYSACAKLYKKAIIENVRFPEGRKAHEDSYFVFCCLAQRPTFGVYDKTVYQYYVTPGSASHGQFSEKVFDILVLAEEKKHIVDEQFPEYIEQSQLMLLKANMALLGNLLKTNNKKYRNIEKECIRFVQQNSDCFKEAIPGDGKWFWIIKNGYYHIYKFLVRVKNRIRGN